MNQRADISATSVEIAAGNEVTPCSPQRYSRENAGECDMSNQDPEYPSAEGPGQFEDPGIAEPDDDEGEPARYEVSDSTAERPVPDGA